MPGRLVAAVLLVIGSLGCLRSFAPNLRPRGVHADLPPTSPDDTCMGCHESESEALARLHAAGPGHATMSESGPPLVGDWMVADSRSCTFCHRIPVRGKAERRTGSLEWIRG